MIAHLAAFNLLRLLKLDIVDEFGFVLIRKMELGIIICKRLTTNHIHSIIIM